MEPNWCRVRSSVCVIGGGSIFYRYIWTFIGKVDGVEFEC